MSAGTLTNKPLSYRQRRAIDLWFRNGRRSKARALREAGYGGSIVRNPSRVFSSSAVQRELELRGHGRDGTYDNQQPREVVAAPALKEWFLSPEEFVSKMTPARAKRLKRVIDEAPEVPVAPQPVFVSAEEARECKNAGENINALIRQQRGEESRSVEGDRLLLDS